MQEAIDKLRKEQKDITIILIAHRLSTIKDADKIVVLKSGEVIEEGTHDELYENEDGVYHSLVQRQQAAQEVDGKSDDEDEEGEDDEEEDQDQTDPDGKRPRASSIAPAMT